MHRLRSYFVKGLKMVTRPSSVDATYTPQFSEKIDKDQLISDLSDFFLLEKSEVETKFQTYHSFHMSKGYSQEFGECKTLSFEEAFILYLALQINNPATVVEVGTQFGKSTRRIIDMVKLGGLNSRVICFDIVNQVKYFSPYEAQLIVKDVTNTFTQDVLEVYNPGLIYLDAHPYYLLKKIIRSYLNEADDCILTIHDCSAGLCNPNMSLSRDNPNITSSTGHWERYVLAEVFGVPDPLSKQLDNIQSSTHRLRIFDTTHGLGIIVPIKLAMSGYVSH